MCVWLDLNQQRFACEANVLTSTVWRGLRCCDNDCSSTLCLTLLGSATCGVCSIPNTCCQQGSWKVPSHKLCNANTVEGHFSYLFLNFNLLAADTDM